MSRPASVVGIRDGHRYTTTVTGPVGALSVERRHHPDCPCHTPNPQLARTARRRKPTTH